MISVFPPPPPTIQMKVECRSSFQGTEVILLQFKVFCSKKKIFTSEPPPQEVPPSLSPVKDFTSALSRKRKYNKYVLQSLCAPLVIWIHFFFFSPPPPPAPIANLVFESRVFLLHKLAVFRSRREIALFAGDINISLVVWQRGQQAGNTCVQQRNPRKVHYTKPAQTLFPGGPVLKKKNTTRLYTHSCSISEAVLSLHFFCL